MPHFKCVTCRTRLHHHGDPAELLEDRCPGCGSAFEPAGELAELVGFQAITTGSSTPQRLVDLVGRRALQTQARLDAERWIDDGGGAAVEAVAMPRPDTTC